jgi:hypothetical protein
VALLIKGDEAGLVQRRADVHARVEIEREMAVDAIFRNVRIRNDGVETECGW